MAKVEIIDSLTREIQKKFKSESHKIVKLLRNLEKNPKKGKPLGSVAGILIKEIRYKKYRFYFIVEGHRIKIYDSKSLKDLLIRFVRMSDKKSQQKTIEEIKHVLRNFRTEGF